MSSEIEDPDKSTWREPTPAELAVGDALVQSEQRDQERVDETGLDESEKDDEAGAATAEVVEEVLPPREPGVNRRYGEPGETGSQAFQRQHREATGQEPPEPV